MKKFTLFLVAMTMSLFSFAAQPKRIYAYGLSSTLVDKVYTFTFTANETPTSGKIIFYDATSGELVGEIALTNPVLGQNEVEIAEYSLPGNDGQQLNWAVELSAAAVTAIDALNDPNLSQFKFFLPQDVAVDNSTESDFFGRVYVANPVSASGYCAAGISVYDQELNKLGDGYMASGVTYSTTTSNNRTYIHRIAVHPKTGKVYYTQSINNNTAIYEMTPHATDILTDGGSVKNVINGVSEIKNANSLCFDENGLLWILNYANYVDDKTTGVIYSVDNKVATLFTKNDPNIYQWVSYDNAIAPDGLGGFWVAQYRSNFDGFYVLSHVNKEGVLDFYINNKTNNTLIPTSGTGSSINASYRGHLAYYSKEKMLAFGGADRVSLFTVNYDAGGKPTLTKIGETPSIRHTNSHKNIDGIAFDYAGNLYMASATREKLFIYTLPTTNNTCEVPAKKADVVTKVEPTVALYTITTNVNDPTMGSVSGNLGTYEAGASAELTAVANDHYEFTSWTGDVNSTENPLTINVDGNKNITANFAKKQYTLTVFVNDENKGTIDVATGSHEYGTEVTLTATPKPGYKLLAWSNKATTPSITLTMDNNKAVSAYFVKEYAADPTFTIEKVWENTINIPGTGNGYQAVGWDGKIYMQDAGNKKIKVFSNGTDEAAEYASSGAGQQIAVDEAGNLIVFNAWFATGTPNAILIYKKGSTEGKAVTFTLLEPGRCDFFTASGDIYSAEGGYIYFYCNGTTVVNRLKITNGAATAADVTTDVICANLPGAGSQSNVIVDIFGNIHVESKQKSPGVYNITNLTTTTDTHLGGAGKKTLYSTIGGCTFELGGKEWWAYLAGTTDYSSEWQLYNETDGTCLSNELYLTDTKTTAGTTANWLNAQVIDEKTVYIYQFCPKVGAALWEVTMKENYLVSATATNGTVSGTGTYQEGATANLTATPNTGYKFVNWTKGGEEVSTEATYSFSVTENVELVANFEAIASKDPRAWAYDMKLGEDGDKYTFTFKATTAGQATISFKDKDGNALAQPESQTISAVAGENKFTIAKNAFAAGVDAFWSITMDGAPIEGVVEVTDQSLGIYDFYNMMGVVVDNNTDSKDFGKIYIQQSYERSYASSSTSNNGITTRANEQTSGIFVYNQDLDELNDPSNVGYKPTVPAGYTEIGSSSSAFQRLNIDPKTGNLVFSHAIEGKPAVFAINRDDMTGAVTNLLTGVADMTRSVAHCFDAEGMLYVMDFAGSTGAIYKVVNGEATKFSETSNKFINAQITIASDGRGGLWVSQNRGQIDFYYQLVHITSEGAIDWSVYDDLGTYVAAKDDNPGKLGTSSLGWLGSSSRGALAYDVERQILAQGRNGKVELYSVSYEPTITLTPLHTIASNDLGTNIDGLAFDYAGDLYVVNSSKEKFQKFTLPTADNICTVAAPALEAIRSTPVHTVSVASNNNEWGIVSGGGTYEENETATLSATPATNYKFVNWTKDDAEVSTENPYTFAVTESATYVANFVEKTQYTINVTYDNTMGTVTGVGSYYEGTEVTLTATAKGGYVFVKWSDEVTDESRTFTASENVTLQAIFKVATPRAWAYDLKKGEDSDNYTFTFTATSDGNATILFTDKDGNAVAPTQEVVGAVTAGETKTISIAKTQFTGDKDIYWSVELAGDAIAKMAEITDPTRNIYDFYNMMGVVVDNDPNSDEFGKIYIQQSYNGASDGIADRSDTQKAGIFIYNQALEELNDPANTGIKPQLPYTIGANRQVFKRITINPANGDIAFCNNTTTNGGAYAVSRENLAGEAINLTKHISDIQKVNALCFDDEGNLYVVANVTGSGAIYKIEADGSYIKLTLNEENLFVDPEIAMAYDGHGGLWIAQNRWGVVAGALFHVNVAEDKIDFKVEADKDYSDWFAGANYRGAIAYDKQRNILAVHSQARASVFQVTYAADGVPSIAKICQTPNLGRNELDGLAFDYAGDLYVVHSGTERFYKYVLPTNNNTCIVPAPESQVIQKETRYTVTVAVNDNAMGTATGGGTEFLYGDEVTVTAVANTNYEFLNWTENGTVVSTDAEYTFTVERDRDLVANFQVEPLKIKGIVKRAVQIGESTVVLTHETDGTPHLYKVVDGTLEAEISQVGVGPAAVGYLSISDIAATEDGKLVACNYVKCTFPTASGTTNFYKWNTLADTPTIWFTAQTTGNYSTANMGYSMAVKGTSSDAQVTITAFNVNTSTNDVRFTHHTIADGKYQYSLGVDSKTNCATVGSTYELNASPLASANWIFDGENITPTEFVNNGVDRAAVTINASLDETLLGKKFNGATYFSIGNLCFMVAPYADASGNVIGVKVLDINNGFAAAKVIETLDLAAPAAGTAVATAVKVDGYDLAITLVVDATIYTFDTTIKLEVVVDEKADNTTALAPYVEQTVTATVNRSFTNDSYKTITLPFSMTAAQISAVFGDATVFEFINVIEGQSEINLRFRPTSEIVAGTPYIIALPEGEYDAKDGFTIEDVVIDTELRPIKFDNITMQPVLNDGGQLTKATEYWLATDNCLYNVNDPAVDMPGLRAYFISSSPLPIRARVVYEDNEETELPIIKQPENIVRKIMKDGQIIIIRGEQQYNVQGQRID